MKFLQQVAKYYSQKANNGNELADYIMVFPNRRSAKFFGKYLKQFLIGTTMQPRLITITNFTQELCPEALGEPLELLFILYNVYKNIYNKQCPQEEISFDSFVNLGNTLLNDFNEIDAYMVDSKQLFKNINNEREIQSYYLSDTQKKVAQTLGFYVEGENDKPVFWKHLPSHPEDNKASKEFVNLWKILGEIYKEFKEKLNSHSLAYSGMQSSKALEEIKKKDIGDFKNRRYAFIGFNVLSTSRFLIFSELQKLGLADFFWDTAYIQNIVSGNHSGMMIEALSKALPCPNDFNLEIIPLCNRKIKIFPVASNVGQVKIASYLVDKIPNPSTIETGLILPDDKLLVPLLYSLSPKVNPINVALQIPFTNTPFASLIAAIIAMQEKAHYIQGDYCFYYRDIMEILSQPYITMIDKHAVDEIQKYITSSHLFNVKAKDLISIAPTLSFIFAPIEDSSSIKLIKSYLDLLLDRMRKELYRVIEDKTKENTSRVNIYEIRVLDAYKKYVARIFALAHDHSISMKKNTFFSLLKKLLSVEHLSLSGVPVEGMQVLGLEDSRVLDFKNLIILSMNERIFPRRNYDSTVIPPSLRKGYGLPTPEQEEMSTAYHFYRLISRAQNLYLIYDSRSTDAIAGGEVSRYVTQLEMLMPKDKYEVVNLEMGLSIGEKRRITVKKDLQVQKELNEFLEGGSRNLSASYLKTYISCPLRFYLQHVKHLSIEDFNPEYMDAASYGTIMHRLAQEFYESFPSDTIFTKEIQKKRVQDPTLFDNLCQKAKEIMNEEYYGNKYELNNPHSFFPGEGRVLSKLMASYVIKMLDEESNEGNFKFLKAEFDCGKKRHLWKVTPDGPCFNFTLSIDRIDELISEPSTLRIIDYKTGTDTSSGGSIDSVFNDKNKGAIFQLLLYCLALRDLYPMYANFNFQPRVYSFSLLGKKGLPFITFNKKATINTSILYDTRTLEEVFREELDRLIKEIFNPKIDFNQTEKEENCKFCPFISLCARQNSITTD